VKIDIDQIRELLAIVAANDIAELTVEVGGEKVTIKKSVGGLPVASSHTVLEVPKTVHREAGAEPKPEPKVERKEAGTEKVESNNGLVPVTSPMVGTFYRSPSPNSPPYVEVGDRIAVGQTVCIIEAMKLMNDMPAEVAGRIVQVCVENGSTVEYGQLLFLVDPRT
jgi:acetyl-CoA carboxylase biotin carboxyl carrier protein